MDIIEEWIDEIKFLDAKWATDWQDWDSYLDMEVEMKLWAVLFDRSDRQIARYPIVGSATIGDLLLNWALIHDNIEYVQVTTS